MRTWFSIFAKSCSLVIPMWGVLVTRAFSLVDAIPTEKRGRKYFEIETQNYFKSLAGGFQIGAKSVSKECINAFT